MSPSPFFCVEAVDTSEVAANGMLAFSLYCTGCGQRQVERSTAGGSITIACISCNASQPLSAVRFLPSCKTH